MDEEPLVDVAYLELPKHFNVVSHLLLLDKLQLLDFGSMVFSLIESSLIGQIFFCSSFFNSKLLHASNILCSARVGVGSATIFVIDIC